MIRSQNALDEAGKLGKISQEAQRNVVQFYSSAMTINKQQTGFQEKMDAIDIAYARYKEYEANGVMRDGKDNRGSVPCGNVFDDDDVTPPIVVSQVDSYVAYLTDVFLSGSPLFPVVSNPGNKKYAEQLETLLDDHASLGAYPMELLSWIVDGVKYNFSAIEVSWESIDQFNISPDFTPKGQKVIRKQKSYNRLKRLDPRNVIRDLSVDPKDASKEGDYIGYVERMSKMRMKKLLNKLTLEGKVYNADKVIVAIGSSEPGTAFSGNYRARPIISEFITAGNGDALSTDWDSWFGSSGPTGNRVSSYGTKYEMATIYVRLMPSDFAISAPQRNTPQIWKFRIVNSSMVISAERIISAYDVLPILIGAPMEDGMGLQTAAIGESGIPFQKAASTLYNIRFAAARRAVSDRALYLADHISEADVNSKVAAPKIPVRMSILSNKTLDSVYHSIPFESRGLETVMQDAGTITSFGDALLGLNKPRMGQFQKGNKSVQEWNDTTDGSDNRMRLRAMVLEHTAISPLRSIMVLNLFQNGDNAIVVSQKSGDVVTIDMTKLRQQVLAFRVGDGYTPKSKLASSDAIGGIMQLISTSPILQQAYGNRLPGMLTHLAQLQGVRGLEEYDPNYVVPDATASVVSGMIAPAAQPPTAVLPDPAADDAAPIPMTP